MNKSFIGPTVRLNRSYGSSVLRVVHIHIQLLLTSISASPTSIGKLLRRILLPRPVYVRDVDATLPLGAATFVGRHAGGA